MMMMMMMMMILVASHCRAALPFTPVNRLISTLTFLQEHTDFLAKDSK
jgi:hypothetical protein